MQQNSLACFALFAALLFPTFAVGEDRTTIFITRHAEKADTSRDAKLSKAGLRRAKHLARVLNDAEVQHVHSTNFRRTKATAGPTAKAIGAKLNLYSPRALTDLVAQIRRKKGRHLVVGHTNTVPKTIELLGGDPGFPIDESSEFDRLYIVTLGPGGKTITILMRYGSP